MAIEKLGVTDHIEIEKGDHRPQWDEVELIDKLWERRKLKESAHILLYKNILSRPSIGMNTINDIQL